MMGSKFREAMQNEVATAIDEEMGEPVIVTPVDWENTKTNFPKVMVPGRAVQVIAVFTSVPVMLEMAPLRDRGHSTPRGVKIETSKPAFSFRYGVLPFECHHGMQIKLCRTGETFEVKSTAPDAVSRIVCEVVQVGQPWYVR